MKGQVCKNCKYRDKQDRCRWALDMPPAIKMIFNALHSEPMTHINWEHLYSDPIPVADEHSCNQFQPNQEGSW